MKEMEDWILIFFGLVMIVAIAYGGWQIRRWFNWNIEYKDAVEQLIEEKVKSECIK